MGYPLCDSPEGLRYDTLIVFDGLLRSKVFAGDLFGRLLRGMEERIIARWLAVGGSST